MRTGTFMLKRGAVALTLAVSALVGNQAFAKDYYLRAGTAMVTMPDNTQVAMWGYADCSSGPLTATCGSVTVPGPALTVPFDDTTLTVHLWNSLPVPTSLVINGLIKPMVPVWDQPSATPGVRPSPTARVRSFDAEVAPGGTADYTWLNVKPGTYLYQSGTQPQWQVQMGLYGAVTKSEVEPVAAIPAIPAVTDPPTPAQPAQPPVPGQAYAGVAYDNQATLLFSEIDPAMHAAVQAGTYGPCPTAAPCPNVTSAFDYQPKYFLINGRPYASGAPVIKPAGNPGQTLLRLLNAGLVTHVPMIHGNYWEVLAEDGKPYPYPLKQYTAMLSAAKTMDVRLTAEVGTTYAIMDRRLSLSNNGLSGGGMLAFVGWGPEVASGGGTGSGANGTNQSPNAAADPAVANDPLYTTPPGVTLNVAAPGVLINDTDADVPAQTIKAVAASGPTINAAANGTYTLNANGSFTYTPGSATFVGTDTFTYRATDGQALSASAATVTITVAKPLAPTPPILDAFDDRGGDVPNLGANWSPLESTNVQVVGNEAAINQGGLELWTTPFGSKQAAAMKIVAVPENSALILKATGGTIVGFPDNYIRVRYEPANGIVVSTLMSGTTAAVYVTQAAFPAVVATNTVLAAAVDEKGLVTVFSGGNFIGGVQLPDVPAWKGTGRIGIQLQATGAKIDDFRGQ